MDKYLGKKLDGRYEIMEIIGIGGMANVYKAYDVIENRVVAVKILRDEYMGNEDMRRRFKNESKAMAVLNHPNVMRVYDVSFSDRLQSIVMEFIDGITLKEYIEQQGVMRWKEAVHFTVQILRALQHAHDKGIVHRDIKPQNIMLLSDGTIKLTDFGIARFARSETRTLTDKAIGSVHYISPEQAAGGEIDARTDIYSVGVILYEMLTGKVPFEAESPVSVALKQIQSKATLPRELNPSIPEGLQEIILHAMEKDLNKRYQSAAQMLRDIDEFKRDPSISFEYKYLTPVTPPGEERYSEAIQTARKAKKEKKVKRKRQKPKRAPIIPVLAGVTTAFVLVTAAFIGFMIYLNNPFASVEDATVPTLVGQRYDLVRDSTKYSQFVLEAVESDYSTEYGKGYIYDQSPKAGTKVKVNSTIKVKISTGQLTTRLPDFAEQEVSQVVALLTEWGIGCEQKQVFDEKVAAGCVVRTMPAADAEVTAGEVVTVYVSLGKEDKQVPVPDLKGISIDDVKTLLDNYKLKVGKITYDEESDEDAGVVVGQSPAADELISQNSEIDLTVAGSTGGSVRLAMQIQLPELDREVEITATQDGREVQAETLNPAETRVWKPVFEGEGTAEVNIFFDGELYQVYELDFDRKGHVTLYDFSDEFSE